MPPHHFDSSYDTTRSTPCPMPLESCSQISFHHLLLPNMYYGLDTRHVRSHQAASPSAFSTARSRSFRFDQNDAHLWTESDLLAPDVRYPETLLTLAKMTSNAYNKLTDRGWYELEFCETCHCILYDFDFFQLSL
jgi:putative lipase involved disintegration of autophagic bodies